MSDRLVLAALILCLLGCAPTEPVSASRQSAAAPVNNLALGGGTDVGNGGNGLEAEWKNAALDLEDDIRRLVVSRLPDALLNKIKAEFPHLRAEAAVEFKDYPLILELEKAGEDNPSHAHFELGFNCKGMAFEGDGNRERDAINFPSAAKIKVSSKRMRCYSRSDQLKKLVLHEYLGLMGLTERAQGQTHYAITGTLFQDFDTVPHSSSKGTKVILVKTCEDFQRIGYDAKNVRLDQVDFAQGIVGPVVAIPTVTWRLANDIDCRETQNWNAGQGFQPRVLYGNLDGNGYGVTSLFMKGPAHEMPFSLLCNQCFLQNLKITDAHIVGSVGLIGQNYGHISHLFYSGEVESASTFAAAGAFLTNNGVVEYSKFDVKVHSAPDSPRNFPRMGGITIFNFGQIKSSEISLEATAKAVWMFGAIASQNHGLISDCSAKIHAVLQGGIIVGGLVGDHGGKLENSSVTGLLKLINVNVVRSGPPSRSYIIGSDDHRLTGIGGLVGHDSEGKAGVSDQLIGNEAGIILNSSSNLQMCGLEEFENAGKVWQETSQPIVGGRASASWLEGLKKTVNGTSRLNSKCVD